jgi:hypothetical protein
MNRVKHGSSHSEILIALAPAYRLAPALFPSLHPGRNAHGSAMRASGIQQTHAMGYTLFLLALFILSAMSLATEPTIPSSISVSQGAASRHEYIKRNCTTLFRAFRGNSSAQHPQPSN